MQVDFTRQIIFPRHPGYASMGQSMLPCERDFRRWYTQLRTPELDAELRATTGQRWRGWSLVKPGNELTSAQRQSIVGPEVAKQLNNILSGLMGADRCEAIARAKRQLQSARAVATGPQRGPIPQRLLADPKPYYVEDEQLKAYLDQEMGRVG